MSIASSHGLTVLGKPTPQGSMKWLPAKRKGGKTFPVVVASNQEAITTYREAVRQEWLNKYAEPILREGSVDVTLVFAFRRPDSHFKAKTKSGRGYREVMKDDAPNHHTGKPDLDKLCRAALDALTGLAYADDKQVAVIHAIKVWSNADSTTIILKGGDPV